MLVTRIFEIECAHRLPEHDGKCRNPHGHSYRVEVSVARDTWLELLGLEVESDLYASGPKAGMIVDFADLEDALRPLMTSLDHHDLNDALPQEFQPPTAEHLTLFLLKAVNEVLRDRLDLGVIVRRVRVYETAKAYVEEEVVDA